MSDAWVMPKMPPPGCQRPTITTNSGKIIYLDEPADSEFDIEDIARSLSRVCRYAGHISGRLDTYSVAEHSVRVSMLCEPHYAYAGVLHDCAEAYLGDVTAPLKNMPEMFGYRALEQAFERALSTHFCVELWPMRLEVKQADELMYATEQRDVRDLFARHTRNGISIKTVLGVSCEPLPYPIEPWTAKEAEQRFLDRVLETQEFVRVWSPR